MDAVHSRLVERITRLTRHARNIGLCPHMKNPRFYRGVPFLLHGNGQRNTNPNAVMRISPSPYCVRITLLWWTWRDSNSRPLGCEPNALPNGSDICTQNSWKNVEKTRILRKLSVMSFSYKTLFRLPRSKEKCLLYYGHNFEDATQTPGIRAILQNTTQSIPGFP